MFPLKSIPLFGSYFFQTLSYYGTRTVLMIYLSSDKFQMTDKEIFALYGLFTSMVYGAYMLGGLTGLFKQFRIMGYIGNGLSILGVLFLMTAQDYTGALTALIILAIGTGLYRPNVIALLAKSYNQSKDLVAGFVVLYVLISLGGLAGSWISDSFLDSDAILPALVVMLVCYGVSTFLLTLKIPEENILTQPEPSFQPNLMLLAGIGLVVTLLLNVYYWAFLENYSSVAMMNGELANGADNFFSNMTMIMAVGTILLVIHYFVKLSVYIMYASALVILLLLGLFMLSEFHISYFSFNLVYSVSEILIATITLVLSFRYFSLQIAPIVWGVQMYTFSGLLKFNTNHYDVNIKAELTESLIAYAIGLLLIIAFYFIERHLRTDSQTAEIDQILDEIE
jgi:POT family proton-dependent oligopeptide transporter